MKRSHWLFLVCAAVFGLAPSFAQAITPFEATRISSLTIAGSNTSSPGGLVELQNTGLVITDLADSSYTPSGSTAAVPGFAGVVDAILDGRNGGNWQGTQGITGINAMQNAANSTNYCIAFDYLSNTGFASTGWGGVQFSASDSAANNNLGDLLVRETYAGDALLNGTVDITNDLVRWQGNAGSTPPVSPSNQIGPAAGDFAYNALTNSSNPVVDITNDLVAWQGNVGNTPLGSSAVHSAGSVGAVPEPGTISLLLVAILSALAFAGSSLRRLCVTILMMASTRFLGGARVMRKILFVPALLAVVALLAATANAELVYILRPVTGDAGYIQGGGNGGNGYPSYSEGSYTITGNGVTTPYQVTITSLPTGSAIDDISFQVYAAIIGATPGASYSQMGVQQAAVAITNTPGSAALSLSPDIASLVPGPSNGSGTTAGVAMSIGQTGAAVGSNWGVPVGSASPAPSSVLDFNTAVAGFAFPSKTYTDLSTVGDSATAIPSAIALTGGTVALIRLGDLSFSYGSAETVGSSTTLQVVSFTGTGSSYNSSIWWDGATSYSTNTKSPAGGLGKQVWQGTNAGLGTSLAPWGGISTTAVTVSFGTQSVTTVSGVTDITSGPTSSAPSVLPGGTATISGVLTNTTTAASQDSVNWNAAASSANGGTLNPTSLTGTGLVSGGSAALSYTYTAPGTGFLVDTVTLTPSGTNATIPGSAGTNTGPKSTTISVIGLATVGAAGAYGPTLTSPSVTSYAGLQTQLSNTSTLTYGLGATSALILAGSSSSPTTLTEAWRSPSPGELAGAYGHPLFSDVVNLNGIASGSTYVLQMSYDPNQVPLTTTYPTAAAAAADGNIYLGYNAGTMASPMWVNAGTGGNLGAYSGQLVVGDWGVNTSNNTAWAVLNHDAEFAVVPEPGTLALLAAGVFALGFVYRRRKVAKA
ncbi:MAG: PEP-CTERM sorting domain-containing protein [Thermoguttaceae bacterium]